MIINLLQYWDDPADSVRPNEGTLLPLWKFPKPASTYPSMVTALAWNPVHDDLFAVGYGNLQQLLHNDDQGSVALHSILCPCRPQSKEAILLPASVLCLDFHPVDAHLLAVGCSNGTVHIVDCQSLDKITSASKGPELMDSAVTQIRWIKQHMGPSPCFLASSIKGEITEWKMNVSVSKGIFLELVGSCRLTVPPRSLFSSNGCPPHQLEFPAPILCFDIDPMTNRLILGNQDGSMVCAFAPSCGSRSQHSSNNGDCHDGPVVSVAWRDVSSYEGDAASTSHLALLTASGDWSVRLWDSLTTDGPLRLLEMFDMGAPLADVAWSPACSTIFGAVTESGVAHFYDMAKDVRKPLCTQRIVSSKVTLTRLAFNPLHRAIVAVGDGRGCVHCFKLSPNLRGASSGGDTLNGGHRNETGGGMRTVVTRRARQKKMENGENASCRQKDTESIKAVSPQMPMEPLRQVLKNARLRREAEVCFDSL